MKPPRRYLAELGRKGGKQSWANLTPEQRSERARRIAMAGTPEQRKARSLKALEARRKRRTEEPA